MKKKTCKNERTNKRHAIGVTVGIPRHLDHRMIIPGTDGTSPRKMPTTTKQPPILLPAQRTVEMSGT
jgi:hypothetical protein